MNTISTRTAAQPSPLAQLMAIHQRQQGAFAAMMEAHQYNSAGNMAAAGEAFARNIALCKEAIELAKVLNKNAPSPYDVTPLAQMAVNSLFVQADTAQSSGDLAGAERLRAEALELSRSYLGVAGNATTDRARASSLIMQGRFSEALVALASARDQFQALGEVVKGIRATMDMVDILQWLYDNQRAARELERAASASRPLLERMPGPSADLSAFMPDFKRIEEMAELSRIQTELDYYQGLIQKNLGHFSQAEEYFRKVLPRYQAMGVGESIEFQFAVILSKRGDYQGAWSLLQQLAPKFQSDGRFRPKLAVLLKVAAEILLKIGRAQDALGNVNQAITDLGTYTDPDQLWRCWALRSEVLVALHREDEAVESYQKTAMAINTLRLHPLGHRLDSTFLQDKLPVLEEAIDLCCARGRGKECATFIDMLKSRALLALLSAQSFTRDSSDPQEKRFEEVTRQLDTIDYQQFAQGSSPELDQQKQALLAERSQLLERLRYSDPRWRSLSQPVATDLDAVARVLAQRNQAAITLYYRPGKIVAVLLHDGSFTLESMDISPETRATLDENMANLHASSPDYSRYDLSAAMGLGARHLIPPRLLEMGLKSGRLLIVPHGPLHLVPWAGLIYQGKRLFEYCAVGILPNLGCISALKSDFSTAPRLGLIGAPDYSSMHLLPQLPSADQEIRDLAALYGEQMVEMPFTGKAATGANFWKLLAKRDARGILHAACHAMFEPLEPMRSGLLLADAKVDAAEIASVRIPFAEVVLSACSTGYRPTEVEGVVLAGDDILGLPAAFLEAGATAVLVSIPTADDRASEALVMHYHQQRRKGISPLGALQNAQLAMLESQFEPFQWIGFSAYAGE